MEFGREFGRERFLGRAGFFIRETRVGLKRYSMSGWGSAQGLRLEYSTASRSLPPVKRKVASSAASGLRVSIATSAAASRSSSVRWSVCAAVWLTGTAHGALRARYRWQTAWLCLTKSAPRGMERDDAASPSLEACMVCAR